VLEVEKCMRNFVWAISREQATSVTDWSGEGWGGGVILKLLLKKLGRRVWIAFM
jgi:hypothetical protein